MSARFVYWVNVSLDLFVEHHAGEHSAPGPDWIRIDEQLHREFNARARGMSMLVEGRVVYEMMDPFWPDARSDASLPDFLREYGEIWTAMPKILVSRTRTTADHNTRIIGGTDDEMVAELAAVRQRANGDIGVGGPTIATKLLRAGLLDELLLFTHPALLGSGRPIFDSIERDGASGSLQLDLLEQRRFTSGVTMHRYTIR